MNCVQNRTMFGCGGSRGSTLNSFSNVLRVAAVDSPKLKMSLMAYCFAGLGRPRRRHRAANTMPFWPLAMHRVSSKSRTPQHVSTWYSRNAALWCCGVPKPLTALQELLGLSSSIALPAVGDSSGVRMGAAHRDTRRQGLRDCEV
jgi:hypothetical protein